MYKVSGEILTESKELISKLLLALNPNLDKLDAKDVKALNTLINRANKHVSLLENNFPG